MTPGRNRPQAARGRDGQGTPMIRKAQPQDRATVEALLAAAALPLDGVEEHFGQFFVVDEGGRIVGAAGLEIYGAHALLRSVVVADNARGRGLGLLLTRQALREVKARGAHAVCLLTTTAEPFFLRFGFERIARDDVPRALRQSREFQGACPASAIAMQRRL